MSRSVAPPGLEAARDEATRANESERSGARAGVALAAGGFAFAGLAGAGLLMWAAQGDAVFTQVVLAALAWCF